MKPPFAYYGGKTRLAPRIAALFPPHRTYVEPFFGSGSVLFAKTPATHEIINDLDGSIVAFFRCLRDKLPDLEEACRLTPHARDEYSAAVLDEDLDDLELARRFWVRVNQSFAKNSGRQTGWSVTHSRTSSVPHSVAGRLGRFAACAERLMAVSIEHTDACSLIERMADANAVVYADPPYLAETRRSRDRQRPGDYRHDMGEPADHEQLARVLHATDATVFLSAYHSPLYDELYDGWDRIEWPVNIHASNSTTSKRGSRVEVLWSNRSLAGEGQLDLDGAAS